MGVYQKRMDLTDQGFDRLTVLEFAYVKNEIAYWKCQCDCGNEKYVRTADLRNGHTKSCGCLQRERASKANTGKDMSGKNNPRFKHGLTGTKEYSCIKEAKRRAKKLNQTPILTENEKRKISLYYTISAYLGDGFHVDHIIPLSKGGLHHPDNLQIITAEENLKKSDKLDYQVNGYVVKI